MLRPRALFLLFAAGAGACSTNPGNPFADASQTVAPGPGSDIVFTTNSYTSAAGSPRELFAVEASGAGLARLTFCNSGERRCDSSEAAPAPDRERVAVLRVSDDTNGDGRLTAADGQALVVVDLGRSVEGRIVPQSRQVSGVDWSRSGEVLVYSAGVDGGLEDLFRIDPSGQDDRNLTVTPNIRERRPRLDPAASVAVYERTEADGKSAVFIFASQLTQTRVTSGGPGSAPLAGTHYVVGADADPAFSPDGRSIVFRRLTGTGNGGLGTWDVLTVRTDASGLAVVASGPVFRGAPDWGPEGIVFAEADVAGGTSQLVVIQPDGTGRRSILSVPAALDISNPRWLP